MKCCQLKKKKIITKTQLKLNQFQTLLFIFLTVFVSVLNFWVVSVT